MEEKREEIIEVNTEEAVEEPVFKEAVSEEVISEEAVSQEPVKKPKKKKKKKQKPKEQKEIAIEVKDLIVEYRAIESYSIKRMLLRGKKARKDDFRAVDKVSFSIPKGEIWGIIGKNGSGKSTLLRAIAGIFAANGGTVDLHGHTVSLLAIGVGFNKDVSGRENILLSGMLLGFSREEIMAKMDEIIAFSELGKFIDKPVRTYSSGMHSKLAFSVAAFLDTEILLIDEVLSVGDEHFRQKSRRKMEELINDSNRTVVIVSHSIRTLREICTKVIWMHEGKIKKIGKAERVLKKYKRFMRGEKGITNGKKS